MTLGVERDAMKYSEIIVELTRDRVEWYPRASGCSPPPSSPSVTPVRCSPQGRPHQRSQVWPWRGVGLEGAWQGGKRRGRRKEGREKEGMDIGKLTDGRRREGRKEGRTRRNEKAVLHSTHPPTRALSSHRSCRRWLSPNSVKGEKEHPPKTRGPLTFPAISPTKISKNPSDPTFIIPEVDMSWSSVLEHSFHPWH